MCICQCLTDVNSIRVNQVNVGVNLLCEMEQADNWVFGTRNLYRCVYKAAVNILIGQIHVFMSRITALNVRTFWQHTMETCWVSFFSTSHISIYMYTYLSMSIQSSIIFSKSYILIEIIQLDKYISSSYGINPPELCNRSSIKSITIFFYQDANQMEQARSL